MKNWLERKKAAFCILAGICAVSVFIIIDSKERINENKGGIYVVKIKHYGIDAQEMERVVTIPMEDALFAIPGVLSVQSSSENSLSNVYVMFDTNVSGSVKRGYYEAVRDAAQRVYETLPSSAQRPEILSTNNSGTYGSRVPVWSSSVYTEDANISFIEVADILDRIVKPRLESLEGAGEVIVSGAANKQIFIVLDQEKINLIGLEPMNIASVLGSNDVIISGGTIREYNLSGSAFREVIVTVDGRYNDEDSLENVLIPLGEGKYVLLSDIAEIIEREREPDILSRLNGRKTAGIAIFGRDGANLQKLSSDIKKELDALELPGLEFVVLSDLGAEEAKAHRSVLNAALSGALMVALISFLLNSNHKRKINLNGILCSLTIPVICLISMALLSIGGFSLDRLVLAGIAAGIGTAVDAVILSSERIRLCKNSDEAADKLKSLAAPLTAGAATTVAALLPLTGIEEGSVKIIAISIAVVCITALVISLTLLPPLIFSEQRTMNNDQFNLQKKGKFGKLRLHISRSMRRLLAANARFCMRYPVIVLGAGAILTAAAVFALFSKGVDTADYGSEDSVYAQVEFDGGLLAEEADRLLAVYSEQLIGIPGIRNVETGARTGSGSLLISFDPDKTNADHVRESAKQISIPGGFIFFFGNSNTERSWEIKIYGDEDKKCRELTEELANTCINSGIVRSVVLNFKQGSKKLVLIPDREILAEAGISFSKAANITRIGVYGPVSYKRMSSNGEVDVRIITNSELRQSREDTLNILVLGGNNNAVHVDTLMKKREETEPSSIRRDDRRRTASITISTDPMDPRRVRDELKNIFEKVDLPPGYSIEFDPAAIRQAKALSATVLSLVMAILFCYMIIASINDSFTVPLIALAAIPPSLSVPALVLALSGSAYNSAIACAFIAVSGMTVNAAVLCADGIREKNKNKEGITVLKIYSALRKKMPALLAITATTVAGAIPFLFLKEGANTLIRTISLVGAMGVSCSCLCSMTVIPSLIILSKQRRKNNDKQII